MATRANCLGIPVRYDAHLKIISDSRGIWRWQEIVVGPLFTAFPPREQQAILLHEAGHCKMRHVEHRLLALLAPWTIPRLCREQEFAADRFAAECGFGADLARAFLRLKAPATALHPPVEERIGRLLRVGDLT